MNKHGQTLILFVIFLPIFCLFGTLIIDIGLATKEKTKVESTTRIIMNEVLQNSENNNNIPAEIKKLFQENEINIDNLKINIEGNEITVENAYKIDSIFGNLIDIKNYKVQTNITGFVKNEKIEKQD